MKQIYFFIIQSFFIEYLPAQNIKQDIAEIRAQFKWINNQKDFQSVYFENDEFTDRITSEGCELSVFYKNDTIYKIIQKDAVSYAVFTTEFYLKNNQVNFVYRKEENFMISPDDESDIKFETKYEERVYFKNKKIIRHLEKGTSVLGNNLDYQKLFAEYKPLIDTKIIYGKQYDLLQGTWKNDDNDKDWFIIMGLVKQQYNDADFVDYQRMWFDGRYRWFHNTFHPEKDDSKFEILLLNDKKLEMQDRLSGKVLFYSKIE